MVLAVEMSHLVVGQVRHAQRPSIIPEQLLLGFDQCTACALATICGLLILMADFVLVLHPNGEKRWECNISSSSHVHDSLEMEPYVFCGFHSMMHLSLSQPPGKDCRQVGILKVAG